MGLEVRHHIANEESKRDPDEKVHDRYGGQGGRSGRKSRVSWLATMGWEVCKALEPGCGAVCSCMAEPKRGGYPMKAECSGGRYAVGGNGTTATARAISWSGRAAAVCRCRNAPRVELQWSEVRGGWRSSCAGIGSLGRQGVAGWRISCVGLLHCGLEMERRAGSRHTHRMYRFVAERAGVRPSTAAGETRDMGQKLSRKSDAGVGGAENFLANGHHGLLGWMVWVAADDASLSDTVLVDERGESGSQMLGG